MVRIEISGRIDYPEFMEPDNKILKTNQSVTGPLQSQGHTQPRPSTEARKTSGTRDGKVELENLEIRPFTRKSPEIEEVFRLYEDSFPKYERKPFEMVLSGQEEGKMETYSVFVQGQYAALVFVIPGAKVDVLDYLAIAPALRGSGIGSKILNWLTSKRSKPFIVEIESTLSNSDQTRERRKSFYLTNGMHDCHEIIQLFGVEMELLSSRRPVTFDEYFQTMKNYFGKSASFWIHHEIRQVSQKN